METVAGASRALNLLLVAANDGRLEEVCERFNVRVMSAFGSATRSGVKDPNDLDIGVSFRRNLDGLVRPAGLQLRIGLWTALVVTRRSPQTPPA